MARMGGTQHRLSLPVKQSAQSEEAFSTVEGGVLALLVKC